MTRSHSWHESLLVAANSPFMSSSSTAKLTSTPTTNGVALLAKQQIQCYCNVIAIICICSVWSRPQKQPCRTRSVLHLHNHRRQLLTELSPCSKDSVWRRLPLPLPLYLAIAYGPIDTEESFINRHISHVEMLTAALARLALASLPCSCWRQHHFQCNCYYGVFKINVSQIPDGLCRFYSPATIIEIGWSFMVDSFLPSRGACSASPA